MTTNKTPKSPKQKDKVLKIKMKSYDHRLLDMSTKTIADIARGTGSKVVGPIPQKSKRLIFSLLRSPHIYKKAQEQYSQCEHRRMLYIINPSPHTFGALVDNISLPDGVDVYSSYM